MKKKVKRNRSYRGFKININRKIWFSVIILAVVVLGGIYFYYDYYSQKSSWVSMSGEDCDFPLLDTTSFYTPPFEEEWNAYDNKEEKGYICYSGIILKRKLTGFQCFRVYTEKEINNNEEEFLRGQMINFRATLPWGVRNYICTAEDYCRIFKSAFLRKFPGSKPMYENVDCSNYGGEE